MSTTPDNPSNNPHGDDQSPSPVPEKRTVRPPGIHDVRDPSSSPQSADQLTVLAHDLSNMLDGSMRWLALAAAAMPEADKNKATDDLTKAREQIGTVLSTLERMSTMVNAAMRSKSVPIGSPILGVSEATNIAMTIDHAVDVVRPMASAAGAGIKVRIDPRAGRLPAGPLYTVVLNALFNAVQSIASATSVDSLDPGGEIEVIARVDPTREETVIEVFDDGIGLDRAVRNNQAFKHGVTTKDDHSGFGLSMAHQIVEQLEGIITLTQREDRESTTRPGAILRVCIPNPGEDELDREIG
ncbi:MAG: sensor histidine kinase [Phycisphaerales bacterium]